MGCQFGQSSSGKLTGHLFGAEFLTGRTGLLQIGIFYLASYGISRLSTVSMLPALCKPKLSG